MPRHGIVWKDRDVYWTGYLSCHPAPFGIIRFSCFLHFSLSVSHSLSLWHIQSAQQAYSAFNMSHWQCLLDSCVVKHDIDKHRDPHAHKHEHCLPVILYTFIIYRLLASDRFSCRKPINVSNFTSDSIRRSVENFFVERYIQLRRRHTANFLRHWAFKVLNTSAQK